MDLRSFAKSLGLRPKPQFLARFGGKAVPHPTAGGGLCNAFASTSAMLVGRQAPIFQADGVPSTVLVGV